MVKVPAPKTSGEVRSFLGMANTCHEYIPDYATITAPLRELTKKSTVFKWTHTHIRKHLNDPVLTKVKTSLKEGKWDENDHDLKPFRLCADEVNYNVSEFLDFTMQICSKSERGSTSTVLTFMLY
jgi:hypothetical protein